MSFRNAVKALLACTLCLGLAACSSASKDESPVSILTPTGAPALSTLGLAEKEADQTVTVDYVEGTDVLISELAKKDGDYDVIIAPVNVGIKSWNEAETYELAAVVTWGNLYIVGDQPDWNQAGNTIAAFGEGAVPGLVFNELYPDLECDVTFYPSVSEASQALISGQVSTALLAQPVAAVAISKAEAAGFDYSIQDDLQSEWQTQFATSTTGYPQAAVFVKKDSKDKAKDVLETMESFLKDPTSDQITQAVDSIGADVLGIPSAAIAASTWSAQNIHYVKASEAKDDITSFLKIFNLELPDDMIAD